MNHKGNDFKHTESIDALRKIKRTSDISPTKQFKQNTLRSDFKASLSKLINNETRQQGMKELKNIIAQNKTSVSLRIWISVLSENRVKSFEGEALIIGFILNQYKKNLIDPIDKIPSLEKSIFRIIELLRKFFNDDSIPIQMACQKSWLEIYKSCLQGQTTQIKKRLSFDTLQAIINGGADKQSQITSQIIIDGLLQLALSKSDNQFFRQIAKPTLVLFLKTYIIHPSCLTSLQTILSFFKLSNLQPIAQSIIDKIIFHIQNAPTNSLGYKIRSQGCNTLGMAAEQLVSIIQFQGKVMPILQSMATDRIWAVQVAGRKALDIWKRKKVIAEKQQSEKMTRVKNIDELRDSIQSLYLESRQQGAFNPNKSRLSRFENDNQKSNYLPAQKPIQKSNNFLKKDDGSGGGYVHQPLIQQKSSYQPQNKRMNQIKNQISQLNIKPQSQIIDFQQTVPYEQELKVIKNYKAETAPQGFSKSKKPVSISPPPQLDQTDQTLIQNWQKVLIFYDNDQFQNAYKLILQMDDDIYLIRLLVKTGPILDKLTRPTSTKLLKKLLQLMKSDFINQVFLSTINSAIKNNVPNILDNKQNKSIIDIIQNISKDDKLKKSASNLKQKYEDSLSNKN